MSKKSTIQQGGASVAEPPKSKRARKATSKAISGSRPTRRTAADISRIKSRMYDLLEAEHPMTCRQLFYRLVSEGAIAKTEQSYKGLVVRLLAKMRKAGELPYHWLADNTRLTRKPRSYESFGDALETMQEFYRRNIWSSQSDYVEIWSEKDAIAGILLQETWGWGVPLMTCRGYPSISFLHSAAEDIKEIGKPTYLYYFGDYDPSGLDITRSTERGIRELAPTSEIYFERVAVTEEQIAEFNLLTRPTKKSDPRSCKFKGESVEVDAIKPSTLRQLVRDRIESHIDDEALERTRTIEEAERETLAAVAKLDREELHFIKRRKERGSWITFDSVEDIDEAEDKFFANPSDDEDDESTSEDDDFDDATSDEDE